MSAIVNVGSRTQYDAISDGVHNGSGIVSYTLLNVALAFFPAPEEAKKAIRDGACQFTREVWHPMVKNIENEHIRPIFEKNINP